MIRLLLVLLTFISSVGSSIARAETMQVEPVNIEEEVLKEGFTFYAASVAYGEVCSGYDSTKSINVNNIISNQDILLTRIASTPYLRHKGESVEQANGRFSNLQYEVKENYKELIRLEGCSSQKTKNVSVGFEFYKNSLPSDVMLKMNESIIKKGGTITPPNTDPEAGTFSE